MPYCYSIELNSKLGFFSFTENFIDFESLLSLTEMEIEKLVPQLGLRKKILSGLKTLHRSVKEIESGELSDFSVENIEEEVPQKKLNTKERSAEEDLPKRKKFRKAETALNYSEIQNTARKYLDGNIIGRKFLAFYKKGLFDSSIRSQLAECIIVSELNVDLHPKKVISPQRFLELRNEIVEVFPTETAATYYVPRQPKTNLEGAKQPRGKLYDKYTCIIKDLRASGLRTANNCS
ncbi:hypothetical protein M5D96_010685 [Drosophila gunungcola]|uniref:SAM domain-containing protein n=1 Tax=Drosophila gunungcola TaxID=103775 RepID=A0A9P9YGQ4_9MUSC|nr:hypothetical protein M5D96_010685 [Drosophila gunungcola]